MMNDSNHDAMPSPKLALPKIHERRCPYCKSERIAPGGRITAGAGKMKVELRCEVCRTVFLIANTTMY